MMRRREWQRRDAPPLSVSVNLAGPQIMRGNVVETVVAILDETGLAPELLELEVTEGFIMDYAGESVAVLSALRDHGVKVAIDDFGTGHSSLASVRDLPVDTLKIDRAFVGDLPNNPNEIATVRAILAMARQLGLRTIAEGVETAAQRRFLAQEGCDCFQGFLLSRPLPPEAIEPLWQQFRHVGTTRLPGSVFRTRCAMMPP